MRMRQRGVQNHLLTTLLTWGDVVVSVGGGDVSITVSRSTVLELVALGLRSDWGEKLGRLAVVVTKNGTVKTCAIIRQSGRGGRRYRRGV